jgi:hypothetical protein
MIANDHSVHRCISCIPAANSAATDTGQMIVIAVMLRRDRVWTSPVGVRTKALSRRPAPPHAKVLAS